MPDQFTEYQYDDDGNVIDPPIIAEHERKATEASASGDDSLIDIAREDYVEARRRVAENHNKRVAKRREDDERLLREDRQRQDAEASRNREADEQRRARARADELRTREQEEQVPDPSGSATSTGTPLTGTGTLTTSGLTGGLIDAGTAPSKGNDS